MGNDAFQISYAGIYRGRVVSVGSTTATVRIETGRNVREVIATLISQFGGQVPVPPIDSTAIVLIQGEAAIFLGLQAEESQNNNITPPAGVQFNTQDNLSVLRVSKDEVLVSNPNFRFSSTPQNFELKQNNSTLALSNTRLRLSINNDESIMAVSTDAIHLENKKELNLIGSNKVNICSRGNIVMSGGVYSSTETDEFGRLNPAGKIIGKAGEIKLGAGGLFSIGAGKLAINLTSSTLSGGEVPGTGGLDAFSLNIVQGNTLVSSALGNVEVYAMGLPNYIRLKSGAVFDLIYSSVMLSRAKATIENVLGGIYSALDLKLGDANLSASKNINIDALMKTTITGKTGIKLDALTNIDLAALLNITIDGKVKIELKTAMLDLKNAKMINAGPKTVAPTGSGPFCAIPSCVFAGVPHAGSMATG